MILVKDIDEFKFSRSQRNITLERKSVVYFQFKYTVWGNQTVNKPKNIKSILIHLTCGEKRIYSQSLPWHSIRAYLGTVSELTLAQYIAPIAQTFLK